MSDEKDGMAHFRSRQAGTGLARRHEGDQERFQMPVKDGPSCPGCGLANYEGLCPHCRGDQDAYKAELVPPFESSIAPEDSE
jgi:hypothetical protein